MKTHPFTRPTVVAAVELLGAILTQAKFDQLIVRLMLESNIQHGKDLSVLAKCASLARHVTQHSAQIIDTWYGSVTLAEAVVREAVAITHSRSDRVEQHRLIRGLALDGYVVEWKDERQAPLLRAALPGDIDLPQADDEVHHLLKQFGFNVPLGHLDQAIDAHTRGDWAAANSQIRSFLEGLLDAIALHIDPQAAALPTSENRRQWLADKGFLSKSRNELTSDGKNFVNGLFKMLHTDGSHPGLSDEDHCTFRLHLGLITGRTLLRRLDRVG